MNHLKGVVTSLFTRFRDYCLVRWHVVRNTTWTRDEVGVIRCNELYAVPTDATLENYSVKVRRIQHNGRIVILHQVWPREKMERFKQDFCN
jgi:hypothetical protein